MKAPLKKPGRSAALAMSAFALVTQSLTASDIQFNRDIKPILAEACFHCHGPDSGTRKADLRLDTEEGLFGSGGVSGTVQKGQPAQSPLYERITTSDPDDVMPPASSHKTLTAEQKELIKKWIEQGAVWQPHWIFVAPAKAELPKVQTQGWARNEIDYFVLSKLEAKNLAPAPEADKRTLARRVSLDITGLPPSPEVVERFAADAAPDAYEKLVDSLLESKAYGEHRARYWLDAARYADTHGLHFDNYREMWPYRDWVVNAFNSNQRFDQFTIEQIAGDLLPNPSFEQLVATGFQRCNITTNEGGTIDEENLALYASDRVQTLSWVYLGLTVNCAQCHDHKFDAITQKDYYAMAAFFRNTTQGPKDGNVKDSGPILTTPLEGDAPRWKALPGELAEVSTQRDARKNEAKPQFDQWLTQARPEALDSKMPSQDLLVHLPLNEGAGNQVTALCGPSAAAKAIGEVAWSPDGKIGPAPVLHAGKTFDLGELGDFESTQSFSYGAWVKSGRNGASGGIIARMDEKGGYRGWDLWQQDQDLGVHIIHQWPDNALKVSTQKAAFKPGKWHHVFVTYDGSRKAAGVNIYIDGAPQKLKVDRDGLKEGSTIRTTTPLRIGQRSDVQVFDGGSVQDVRVFTRAITGDEVKTIASSGPLRAILAAAADKRTPEQLTALYSHYLLTEDSRYQEINTKLTALTAEQNAIKQRSPVTHIQQERMDSKAMTPLLMRGQYDQKGEVVDAAPPVSLGALPADAPKNRMGLARWIVDPANPLTTRVTVNRFWQELFGAGIVKTPDDFGIMGAAPSHPELLDWLAVDFQEKGWDVKRFIRLMVTSATYRQASVITPEKLQSDRDNTLLSRGPRFRMDAEMLRDYALFASGLLSPKMGGPGTRPYQPEGIWDVVGLPGGNTRNYVQDQGENLHRRTIYNFWKRMAPSPNMETFNAPSRETSCIRRDRTNTPLQALVMLNDPQFIEAARQLAQQAIWSSHGDETRTLNDIAARVLSRPLTDPETSVLRNAYQDFLKHYEATPEDASALLQVGETKASVVIQPAILAAWSMVAHQLLNLDETLNK